MQRFQKLFQLHILVKRIRLVKKIIQTDFDVSHSHNLLNPEESDFLMVLPLIVLVMPTLLAGFIGVNFLQKETGLDSLSEWLTPLIVPIKSNKANLIELLVDSTGSVSLSFVGIFISYVMYGPVDFYQRKIYKYIRGIKVLDENLLSSFGDFIQGWSLNRGYINYCYNVYLIKTIVFLSKLVCSFSFPLYLFFPLSFCKDRGCI